MRFTDTLHASRLRLCVPLSRSFLSQVMSSSTRLWDAGPPWSKPLLQAVTQLDQTSTHLLTSWHRSKRPCLHLVNMLRLHNGQSPFRIVLSCEDRDELYLYPFSHQMIRRNGVFPGRF